MRSKSEGKEEGAVQGNEERENITRTTEEITEALFDYSVKKMAEEMEGRKS